ncbi:MAG: hypothetical protein KDE23_24160, partial [Caldilinea sp.]|nr:hypothetical protein [Caldilinea sp.]
DDNAVLQCKAGKLPLGALTTSGQPVRKEQRRSRPKGLYGQFDRSDRNTHEVRHGKLPIR